MALPSGYKRLEYIKSSGTQWIDTGFKPKWNSRIVVDASDIQSTASTGLFGCRNQESATASKSFGVLIPGTTSQIRADYFGKNAALTQSDKTPRTMLDMNRNVFTAFGLTATNTEVSSGQSGINLFLFCYNNVGTAKYFSTYIMYSCRIYDDGNLVRNFIPCQKPDGTVGLWDDVNSVFYGNAGTGTFTAGPEAGVSTPANFRLSSSTENTATLAWDAVDGATGYKLYRDGTLISTLTETSYTDAIQPFVSYVYTLAAYNDNGESDPATISVQVIIPPETPSNFRVVSKSIMEISLAWDAVSGSDSYQLKRDGTVVYTGEFPSYTDSGLTVDTTYTYTLSAVNTAGGSAETTLEAATTQFILVTDRTAADVTAGNAKGTYNASDLNRVGAAMNYVADRLRSAGYDPHISPKTDWKDDDWVDPAAQSVYLGDLAELRKQFTMLQSTPEVPPRILATTINSGDGLTYGWANDIEQILMDIDDMLTRLQTSMFYSAELYSGEV